jgi:hypothetical protein
VIGKCRGARVSRALGRRIGWLRDVETRRILVEVLHVADRAAAIHRDRGREPGVEELTLVVAEDHHRIRANLVELPPQRLERCPAFRESLTPLLDRDFVRETWLPRFQQRLVIVGLPAEPVILVLTVSFRAQIPLLRRRREQRPVRRSDPEDNFCHVYS